MKDICQGDIVKIGGFGNKLFVVTSKNAFIKATGFLHVCPVLSDVAAGPIHIKVRGKKNVEGVVICEQVKLIDPVARGINRVDRLSYDDVINISDVIQGIFEYD